MTSSRSTRSHVGWFTKLSLTLILVVALWQQETHGLPPFEPRNCGPESEYPENCPNGSFVINFDPEFCRPRTLCRKDVNQTCHRYGDTNDCIPGLHCNCDKRCGKNLIICPPFGNRFFDLNVRN